MIQRSKCRCCLKQEKTKWQFTSTFDHVYPPQQHFLTSSSLCSVTDMFTITIYILRHKPINILYFLSPPHLIACITTHVTNDIEWFRSILHMISKISDAILGMRTCNSTYICEQPTFCSVEHSSQSWISTQISDQNQPQ